MPTTINNVTYTHDLGRLYLLNNNTPKTMSDEYYGPLTFLGVVDTLVNRAVIFQGGSQNTYVFLLAMLSHFSQEQVGAVA